MGLLRWACHGLCHIFFSSRFYLFFILFFLKFEGVPNSVIEGIPNFVIEGVPNIEEIKKIKKNSEFFSGQGVPRNTLSCKWRRHWFEDHLSLN